MELLNTLNVKPDIINRYLAVDEVAQKEIGNISLYTAPEIILGWCLVLWYRTMPRDAIAQLIDALHHTGLPDLVQNYFPQ